MIKYIRILSLFLILTAAAPVLAQEAAAPDAHHEVTVNQDDLKKLITTLESETGRTDFITNLKTLSETHKKEGGDAAHEEAMEPLTKALGVDSFAHGIIAKYEAFLARNDLKGSTVGKLVMTLVITLLGVAVIFALRRGATKLLYWFDRAVDWLSLPATRMRLYTRVLRAMITVGVMGVMLYTYILIWDFTGDRNPFESSWFRTSMGLLINVVFVVILATAAWEAIQAVMQVTFRKIDGNNSPRAKTILPIVRNVLFIIFTILFALVLLSELGINILPLLAGAGIVGVAIGFGAQTMVKDFLSGFTLILEDVIRVGDVINVAGLGGVVEKITLRKVQLRDFDGAVYTIPYSEIKTIINRTKDFSFYVFNMKAAYNEDTDKVIQIMKEVGEQLSADPAYGHDMLEPLDVAGVDSFNDSAIIIKARIKTVAGKQWSIGREYNRRIKKAFDAHGIEMPLPQQVTWNANPHIILQDQPAAKNA